MRQIALLRAVNVGKRQVKMDHLRLLFEEMGMRDVSTFIASGNVIFESRTTGASAEKKIEKHLAAALGFDVPVIVRSAAELVMAAEYSAFPKKPALTSAGAMHVGFLRAAPDVATIERVQALLGKTSEVHLNGRELYWYMADRRTVLDVPIAKFEKALGTPATFRNITTVRKLAEKYCG